MKRLRAGVVAIIGAAVVEYGWLAFDGGRALVVGDYLTPSSGPHAGQLGPWSLIVSAVGLDPRSTIMMSIHLLFGLGGLASTAAFLSHMPWGRRGLLIFATLCLWYLPFGTILSLVQIGTILYTRDWSTG